MFLELSGEKGAVAVHLVALDTPVPFGGFITRLRKRKAYRERSAEMSFHTRVESRHWTPNHTVTGRAAHGRSCLPSAFADSPDAGAFPGSRRLRSPGWERAALAPRLWTVRLRHDYTRARGPDGWVLPSRFCPSGFWEGPRTCISYMFPGGAGSLGTVLGNHCPGPLCKPWQACQHVPQCGDRDRAR